MSKTATTTGRKCQATPDDECRCESVRAQRNHGTELTRGWPESRGYADD